MSQRTIDARSINDSSWIKQSFMMDAGSIQERDSIYRTLTTASYKFSDTTPGGNEAINPPPQFTRYADIKVGGDGTNQVDGTYMPSMSRGMGRYYSEALNDNSVHCFMRFGVAQYNSLSTYFTNFYNAEAASLARTGRSSDIFFKAGQVIGFVVGIVPRALVFMGNVLKWFANKPASKYYYLKPAMPLYWKAVTTIVNTLAVNMGVVPPIVGKKIGDINSQNDPETGANDAPEYTSDEINKAMNTMLPEIFQSGGGIDVYALATRYQRLYQSYRAAGYEAITKPSDNPGAADIERLRQSLATWQRTLIDPADSDMANQAGSNAKLAGSGLDVYLAAYMNCVNQVKYTPPAANEYSSGPADNSAATNGTPATGDTPPTGDGSVPAPAAVAPDPANTGGSTSGETLNGDKAPTDAAAQPVYEGGYWEQFGKFLIAELNDGGAFVSFRVDGSGTINESFSNSVKESEIQSKINNMSAQNRDSRFSLENGNISDSIVGKAVGGLLDGAKNLLLGIADQVGLAGIAALAGSAFVDIPKSWDASTANLPRADFTIQLRSPYGNKLARLLNLYIPLAMLLAGALPLATGKQSYTSPFLCEVYCRGRITCRLGMIDSLSITRGAGNVGWNNEGEPLGIDVSFSVVDMSSVMFMPISAGFSGLDALTVAVGGAVGTIAGTTMEVTGGPSNAAATLNTAGKVVAASSLNSTWDDDNAYTDYMAVLGSLTMMDQVSPYRKWKLRVTKQIQNYNTFKSPAHLASWFAGTWPGRIISTFTPTTRRGQTGQ